MSELVYLRALEASDFKQCYKWHNDIGLYDTLGGTFRFVSKEAEHSWLDRRIAFSSNEINLAICVKKSNEHVGNIYLREIDWISRNARLELFIGDRNKRIKGYGGLAIHQLLSYAFLDLGLKKVYLDVLEGNKLAMHVYEKCGFSVEGRRKNHVFKKGCWKDLIIMGICLEDYAVQ